MTERTGVVTFQHRPLTLIGPELNIGDDAPAVVLLDNDLKEFNLSQLKGKTVIVSAVPSLDTPVCDLQTRKFNEEASLLGNGVAVITISMDLPFAQKRWCGASGLDGVITLSDHREAAFGRAWGVLVKELHLLARAVFVVDRNGDIRYRQIVSEISHEPDYKKVLDAANALSRR